MSNGSLDWLRLQDQFQQNETLRSQGRIESPSPVDSPEPLLDESDPWAIAYEPWPAPSSVSVPDATGYSLRSETSISDVADQIFGVK